MERDPSRGFFERCFRETETDKQTHTHTHTHTYTYREREIVSRVRQRDKEVVSRGRQRAREYVLVVNRVFRTGAFEVPSFVD